MSLSLTDALRIPVLKTARVLTDPQLGARHSIASASVIEIPVGAFIKPGEFVMTTGLGIGKNPENLKGFVREIAAAGAGALAIAVGPHTPCVPKRVVAEANRLELPLLELPWHVRFSDVTEAIFKRLIVDKNRTLLRHELVWSLVKRAIDEEEATAHAAQLGINLRLPFAAVVARTGDPRLVETLLAAAAAKERLIWLGTDAGNEVIGFLQTTQTGKSAHGLLASVQDALRERCTVSWGLGRTCHGFHDFFTSYEDARIACLLGMRKPPGERITDSYDVLADHVLVSVWRDSLSQALLDRYIQPLLEFEKIPLVETLQALFESDRNVSDTARKLAISRQSLLYRLRKIEQLLGVDLHDPDHRFAILLSLRLHAVQSLLNLPKPVP